MLKRKRESYFQFNLQSVGLPQNDIETIQSAKAQVNRKQPLAEPDSGTVAICLDQLGFERTIKRGQQAP